MGFVGTVYGATIDPRILGISLLIFPFLCLVCSTISFKRAVQHQGQNKGPPVVPYMVPLLCHAISLGWSPIDFVANTIAQYGWRKPLRVRVGWFSFTMVTNPDHIQTVFRSSKQLHSTPAIVFALRNLLNTPACAIAWYEADNSGLAKTPLKGSTTDHVDRIHFHQAHAAQRFLSNQHLWSLSRRYIRNLEEDLKSSIVLSPSQEWIEFPDLYHFLQMNVTRAMIRALMGPALLETSPTFIEDFWAFDSNVPKLLRALPRRMLPEAYQARDRLLENIKAWHANAHAHADCTKTGDEDPEWDYYFGSKLVRARQDYALKSHFMNADVRASEDLGLLMASNGNAVPSVFWFIYETLKSDQSVRGQADREVAACRNAEEGLDIERLFSQPLLQSIYAEVLRLHVVIGTARQSDTEPFSLGGYQIPKGEPFVIFSRHPALNQEAWGMAGRPPTETTPLHEFHPERFLVGDNKASDPEGGASLEFSMEELAGLWIPYGGGQRMCPGRHFAKNEIIGTFAVLTREYDLELLGDDRHHHASSDLRWFPSGALPPVGKVPFRIRKRVHLSAT